MKDVGKFATCIQEQLNKKGLVYVYGLGQNNVVGTTKMLADK